MGLPAEFYRTQKQGVGVEFSDDEGLALRYRIDGVLKEQLKSGAPTYTL